MNLTSQYHWGVKLVSLVLLFSSLQNNCNSIESVMHFLFPHCNNYKMGSLFTALNESVSTVRSKNVSGDV